MAREASAERNTKETEKVYKISDLTVNCSIKEGLALTSYESLSMGVPVVSVNAGGQKELIDDTVGVVVPCMQKETKIWDYNYKKEEISNYVQGIEKVLNNIDNFKKNCRKRILNRFTIDNMVQKMEKEFDKNQVVEETVKVITGNRSKQERGRL